MITIGYSSTITKRISINISQIILSNKEEHQWQCQFEDEDEDEDKETN